MKIGVKYCGGCNPRHDRLKFLEQVKAYFDDIHFFEIAHENECYDLLLIINGCTSKCTSVDSYRYKSDIWVDASSCIEAVIKMIMEKGKYMWREDYKQKLVSPEEAVTHIESGDKVVVGHACAEPVTLVEAMVANKEQYVDVEIIHMVAMGKSEYTLPGMEKHFRHKALFVGGSTRKAVNGNRADYIPSFFFEIPRLFKNKIIPVDVALIQVSTPDEHGYCSYGLSNDYTKPAAESATLVIAQINDQMPRTLGNNFIHVADIDYIVESSVPMIELPRPKLGDVEKSIGENCATLVDDGSTLQLGIGAIPDAVLLFLKDKKDLGIHSEMFSDGVLDLFEAGVVNNKAKSLNPGKMIVTFIMGTKKLYDFIDDNPMVEMHPVDYVNNPTVIAQNNKMVSINSCIEIDLMGQISSESIGLRQFSGTGGQVDYVRGASMCPNGKSIIAIPSTAKAGSVSRIVPFLQEGSAVTTSRNDVHYVVTEHGVADLRGKTLKERALALINVADPKFRDELMKEVEERFKIENFVLN